MDLKIFLSTSDTSEGFLEQLFIKKLKKNLSLFIKIYGYYTLKRNNTRLDFFWCEMDLFFPFPNV
jgi:hypothetical protein